MSEIPYQNVIDALQRCIAACEHCAFSCLEESDVAMMSNCIKTDISCADTCRLAVSEFARGSMFAPRVAVLCAEVCQACADECSQHKHDHCKACAAACEACVEACHSVATVSA